MKLALMTTGLLFAATLCSASGVGLTTGTISIETAYSFTNMPSSTTVFYGYPNNSDAAWSATALIHNEIIPTSGTIDMFAVAPSTAMTGTQSYTFAFMKNGVATTLSVADTLSSGTTIYDLIDSFHVSAGDTITIRSTPANSPPLLTTMRWAWRFTADNTNTSLILNGNGGTIGSSLTRFEPIAGFIGNQASTTTVESVIPTSGTFKNLWAFNATSAAGVGAINTVTLYKNDVPTSLVVTFSSSNNHASDTTDTVSVVQGDTLTYRVQTAAGSPPVQYTVGVEFDPNTEGQSVGLLNNIHTVNGSITNYESLTGGFVISTSTESSVSSLLLQCTLQNMAVASSGFTSTKVVTVNVNDNFANTGLTVARTGAGAGVPEAGQDNTHTFNALNGDLLDIQVVTGAISNDAPTVGVVFSSGTRTIASGVTKGYAYTQ